MDGMNPHAKELLGAIMEVRSKMFSYTPNIPLSPADFALMRHVHIFSREFAKQDEPGIRLSELAKHLHHATPTVSQRVSELEAAGYLCRQRSETDRRVVFILLTQQGHELMQQAFSECNVMLSRIIDEFGIDRMNQFIAMVREFGETAAHVQAQAKAETPPITKGPSRKD
ncbi:MAG: MarR family transcriptional regulator [Pygmaiobacter massiliensis]|nr:MarR family transcriptional regulator [Pygmaiobacter massiliensis]